MDFLCRDLLIIGSSTPNIFWRFPFLQLLILGQDIRDPRTEIWHHKGFIDHWRCLDSNYKNVEIGLPNMVNQHYTAVKSNMLFQTEILQIWLTENHQRHGATPHTIAQWSQVLGSCWSLIVLSGCWFLPLKGADVNLISSRRETRVLWKICRERELDSE